LNVSKRRKVTVVGAGNVGATCAQVLAQRDYADIVLVDIKEGLPQGKALDINQMGAVLGYEPNVTGSNDYAPTAGSDVVVITAGLPRSPGMSRDDLVQTNEKIVKDVAEKVVAQSPDTILIVVSNPLDAMCHVAKNVSAFPKARVFGQAGILDTARLQTFISWETGASIKDVSAVVLGGHGDQMVSVISATTVGGVPIRALVSEEKIAAMVERTAKGGGEDRADPRSRSRRDGAGGAREERRGRSRRGLRAHDLARRPFASPRLGYTLWPILPAASEP
jgi:malate dehydrogenase